MNKSIRLKSDASTYVDKPCTGQLEPYNFNIYYTGYTNMPIPTYPPNFIAQFMAKAKEFDLDHLFIVDP